jgi:hypothetical protein
MQIIPGLILVYDIYALISIFFYEFLRQGAGKSEEFQSKMDELAQKYSIDKDLTDVAISPGKLPLIKHTKANFLAVTRYFDRSSPEGDTTINKLTNRVLICPPLFFIYQFRFQCFLGRIMFLRLTERNYPHFEVSKRDGINTKTDQFFG